MQPKTHNAVFLIPGLCSYESNGDGVWLFNKGSIDKSIQSLIGKPVQIGHEAGAQAVGYVCGAYFDEALGFYVADFFLIDEKAEDMVGSGSYYPSCAYTVMEKGVGGVYNDIAYSLEVLLARFDHLAIVDSPRYSCGTFDFQQPASQNGAKNSNFELKAVNSGGRMAIFSKTAKNEGAEPEKKEPSASPPAETKQADKTAANAVVEIDGEKISVADLAELYRKAKTADNEGETVLGENETVDIDGEFVKVSELISLWKGRDSAANSGDEDPPPPEETKQADDKTAKNGREGNIHKVKTAASQSNPVAFNSRMPMESKADYNKRMTEKYIGKGGV